MAEPARQQNDPRERSSTAVPANDNEQTRAANDNRAGSQNEQDKTRGLQNIALVTNEQVSPKLRGVEADFDEKSVQGRARKIRSSEQKELQEQIKVAEGEKRKQLVREQRTSIRQSSLASNKTRIKKKKVLKKKGLSIFGKSVGFVLAVKAWFWSALFSLIALSAYMAQSIIEIIKSETFIGWLVGLFTDSTETFMPSYLLGGAFATLSSFIAVIAVFCFLVWFKLVGLNTGNSPASKFASYVLIAISILPIINIFPALVIWVTWANLSSLSRKG